MRAQSAQESIKPMKAHEFARILLNGPDGDLIVAQDFGHETDTFREVEPEHIQYNSAASDTTNVTIDLR